MGVRIETAGPAAVVTMDWPERRNALRPQDGDIERADALAAIDRAVLGHYGRMEREQTWPDDDFFAETARVQAGLICSPQFRDLAARALGTAAPVA